MTLLEKLSDIILKDKDIKENRYWNLENFHGALVINPIGNLKSNQVIFMGENLFDGINKNSYFVSLNIQYPVKITMSSHNCIIEIDIKRWRQYKLKKILSI